MGWGSLGAEIAPPVGRRGEARPAWNEEGRGGGLRNKDRLCGEALIGTGVGQQPMGGGFGKGYPGKQFNHELLGSDRL